MRFQRGWFRASICGVDGATHRGCSTMACDKLFSSHENGSRVSRSGLAAGQPPLRGNGQSIASAALATVAGGNLNHANCPDLHRNLFCPNCPRFQSYWQMNPHRFAGPPSRRFRSSTLAGAVKARTLPIGRREWRTAIQREQERPAWTCIITFHANHPDIARRGSCREDRRAHPKAQDIWRSASGFRTAMPCHWQSCLPCGRTGGSPRTGVDLTKQAGSVDRKELAGGEGQSLPSFRLRSGHDPGTWPRRP